MLLSITSHNPHKFKKWSKKRKGFNRPAIALLAVALGLSTTTVTFAAFVNDRSPVQEISDLLGSARGKQDANPVDVDQALDSISSGAQTRTEEMEDYLRQAQQLKRNIANKNISGILGQLESVLGQLGILSPRDYPGKIGGAVNGPDTTSGVVPAGWPTTPEGIYQQQQMITDTANSDQFWVHTDSVLGKHQEEGQDILAAMKQSSFASSQATAKGYESSASSSEESLKNAELAQGASQTAEQLSQQAQRRTATQDVLKDMAAQHSEVVKSNAAMSNQLATLSNQSAIAAAQTAALSAQSQVSNEHLSELRVGQSMGNLQLHDIYNAQRQANHMQVVEGQKDAQLSVGSTNAIYIPGLFSTQPSPN